VIIVMSWCYNWLVSNRFAPANIQKCYGIEGGSAFDDHVVLARVLIVETRAHGKHGSRAVKPAEQPAAAPWFEPVLAEFCIGEHCLQVQRNASCGLILDVPNGDGHCSVYHLRQPPPKQMPERLPIQLLTTYAHRHCSYVRNAAEVKHALPLRDE
jgi:hypothetical protein